MAVAAETDPRCPSISTRELTAIANSTITSAT
jgi:hypothetical protein